LPEFNVQSSAAANRIVLLGASNLTLSLRLIIQLIQQHCGGPSEVLAAAGHGRSYGQRSQVLVRELPGIVQSGLWGQLHAVGPEATPATYAFLTDVGNDIPYEAAPEKILRWVSWCVDQLQRYSAHIVMTNLPVVSIESLSDMRFRLLRNLLFPTCSLSRDEMVARARAVHQGLAELAAERGLVLLELEPEWMGFDGIHVAYRKRQLLYRQLLMSFECFNQEKSEANTQSMNDFGASFLSWQRRPQFAERRLFGKIKQSPQPSGFFRDRTTVALY